MHKLTLYLTIFSFILGHFSLAQNLIKGQIVNEKNEPIEYVNIGIIRGNKGSISDENGFFKINIPNKNLQDSLYFSHLNYHRKTISIKDLTEKNNKITLQEKEIILSPIEVSATKPKLKTIKGRGLRFPGGIANFSFSNQENFKEDFENGGIGDFINLKNDYVAKEFHIDCIKNTAEKFLVRLNFYSVGTANELTPIISSPIYIDIPKTNKKIQLVQEINVHLPKGKIWVEIQLVDAKFTNSGSISFPISFSGGWIREDIEFEKIPLGLGISFAIKGFKIKN